VTITAERLRQLLVYDPVTGLFQWRVAANSRARIGDVAGSPRCDGCWQIKIDGRSYSAHRLAWLYMTGEWPPRGVNFRNHVRSDASWENLRLASPMQVSQGKKHCNRLGVKGVSLTLSGNYSARIRVNGRYIYLGTFTRLEDAQFAYAVAARLHFGEFARP
jgi:hypothetical protein